MVTLLGGCETVEQLLPDPACEDVVRVDAVTGAAELRMDRSDCVREGAFPERAEYSALADRDWQPLVDPDARPCNTGSTLVLTVDGLSRDDLAVDPTVDPAYAAGFVEDVWMSVRFWGPRSSEAEWITYFRFGHAHEVVTAAECLPEEL